MTEYKGISCVFLHRAEGYAAHPLFQRKLTGRNFLSSTPITQWYAERNRFKYYGLSLEALRSGEVSFLMGATMRSTSGMVSLRKFHSHREILRIVVHLTTACGWNSSNKDRF